MNILTIDDSATMRMLIKKTLQPDGYTILEADNGQSGLNVAAADKIDLFSAEKRCTVRKHADCLSDNGYRYGKKANGAEPRRQRLDSKTV